MCSRNVASTMAVCRIYSIIGSNLTEGRIGTGGWYWCALDTEKPEAEARALPDASAGVQKRCFHNGGACGTCFPVL